MFSGKKQAITIRIPESLVGAFIDQFGKKVTISEGAEDMLLVTFNAVPSVIMLGWLLGLKSVEVVEPQNVKEDIINLIQQNMSFYKEKNCRKYAAILFAFRGKIIYIILLKKSNEIYKNTPNSFICT